MAEQISPIFIDENTIKEIFINRDYTRLIRSSYDSKARDVKLDETKPKLVTSKMRTIDFFNKLNSTDSKLTILPRNCRFTNKITDRTIYVIEDPPMLRTVKFNIGLESEIENLRNNGLLTKFGYENFLNDNPSPPYKIQLSFPYVIYIITFGQHNEFSNMKLFYRLHPLTGIKDYLLTSNLLNVDSNGSVCLGPQNSKDVTEVSDKVDNIINSFWGNEFNNDITHSYLSYSNQREISTILAWKYYSKVDPMFIFDVEWIKNTYNLDSFLNFKNSGDDIRSCENIMYKLEEYILYDKEDEGQKVVDRRYTYTSLPLFEDEQKGSDYLVIGDEIIFEGKKYFIYEIVHESDGKIIVSLEDENGKLIYKKYNTDFRDKIRKETLKNKELTEIKIDGLTVKKGTVLEAFDGYKKRLKHVQKIRKTRDGKIEIQCEKSFYMIEDGSLAGVKVFDINNLTISNGLKIVNGNKYMIFNNITNPIFDIQTGIFTDLKVTNDTVYYNFKYVRPADKKESTINYSGDTQTTEVFDYDEKLLNNSMFPFFRLGKMIISNIDKDYKFHIIKGKGIGVTSSSGNVIDRYDFGRYLNSDKDIKEKILKDNKLRIPSFDLDIEFDIGDRVVIADYSKSLKYITTIRTITGFKIAGDNLFVDTVDENNIPESTPYINFKIYDKSYIYSKSPKVNIGLIRKIIDNDLFKRGTKVRPKVKGISSFKKKDVHEIVGLITDTGSKPIILCSNGHTIWCDEKSLENFELIDKKSKLYNKSKLTEILENEKIYCKFQSGDLADIKDVYDRTSYEDSIHLCGIGANNRIIFKILNSLNVYGSYNRSGRRIISQQYQTIPMPRYLPTTELIRGIGVIPNYHGWFTISNNSLFKIQLEKI